MVLPISTPPNAIAASTGMIEQKDMVKTGLIMGIVGLILGYLLLILLGAFTDFFPQANIATEAVADAVSQLK